MSATIHDNSEFNSKHINLNHRIKRVVVFRPLFVYRQQQIKKTRLAEEQAKKDEQSIENQQNQLSSQNNENADSNQQYNSNNSNKHRHH